MTNVEIRKWVNAPEDGQKKRKIVNDMIVAILAIVIKSGWKKLIPPLIIIQIGWTAYQYIKELIALKNKDAQNENL
jgi:hypothetical protein